jgi:ElaA protein
LKHPTTLTGPDGSACGRQNVTRVLLPNNLLRLITVVLPDRLMLMPPTPAQRREGRAVTAYDFAMHPEPRNEVRTASFADLDTTTLYALLRLRGDVFVVEQKCAYADLDGRDTEPGTRHVWVARDREVLAYLRILDDSASGTPLTRIGRVVVAAAERGGGHAGRLMAHALTVIGHRDAALEAQAHLVDFYARFGFEVTGPEYLEDGIPHVPMRRTAEAGHPDGP